MAILSTSSRRNNGFLAPAPDRSLPSPQSALCLPGLTADAARSPVGQDDDAALHLTTPVRMSLEECIAYVQDDELVEVTPKIVRMRKRFLDPHERKRQARAG